MKILGLHCSFTSRSHDPSACVLIDGKLVAAVEEERLNRIKTSSGFFPEKAIDACLQKAGLSFNDIDCIACDGESYPPLAMKIRRYLLNRFGSCPKIELVNHALAHVYGSYVFSRMATPTLAVSVDGIGDAISTLVCVVEKTAAGEVTAHELYRSTIPDSLGMYYTVFTNFLGFKSIEGEYKVMGMAAYGTPRFDLSEFIRFDSASGRVVGTSDYVDTEEYSSIWEPCYAERIFSQKLGIDRPLNRNFKQHHYDLAASVQEQFTRTYVGLIKHYLSASGARHLCLGGGCALNCLANKELLNLGLEEVSVMPAASDRGLSIGAAVMCALRHSETIQPATSTTLGRTFSDDEIARAVTLSGLPFEQLDNVALRAATAIVEGKVIGWMQGASEFGPRALGHRSILASASIPGMKDTLNAKIKFRESFRPFAPAILEEDFRNMKPELTHGLPYMTFTVDMNPSEKMSEAIHHDGTARVQTVTQARSPEFYSLLQYVKKLSGVGVVINTSFNLAGEPIVDSPSDCIRTFTSSGIDALFMGNYLVTKYR